MNTRLTHGHGWITPDSQLLQVSDPRQLFQALIAHDPQMQTHMNIVTPQEFMLDLYNDGWCCCVTRRGHSWFEHGVNHQPDAHTRHQLVGHLTHHGDPINHACVLYQPDLHLSPGRLRLFGDMSHTS